MDKVHPLRAWMVLHGVDKHELARRLEVPINPNSIRQIAYGHRRPSWDLAFAISAVTKIAAEKLRDESNYVCFRRRSRA
jgi:DNA-binding XRE family transcriptional regulator